MCWCEIVVIILVWFVMLLKSVFSVVILLVIWLSCLGMVCVWLVLLEV